MHKVSTDAYPTHLLALNRDAELVTPILKFNHRGDQAGQQMADGYVLSTVPLILESCFSTMIPS